MKVRSMMGELLLVNMIMQYGSTNYRVLSSVFPLSIDALDA